MYSYWDEITIVFDSNQIRDKNYIEISVAKIHSLKKECDFEKLNIGFPISSDSSLLISVLQKNSFLFEVNTFEYIDLIDRKNSYQIIRNLTENNDSKIIYFKASENTDWNLFLNSLWDLAKVGTEIRLLDSNQIFSQSNSLKKINSLVMRGVILGFYPNFPKKWYQSDSAAIKQIARLKLVDFWMFYVQEIVSNTYQQSLLRKQIYIEQLGK